MSAGAMLAHRNLIRMCSEQIRKAITDTRINIRTNIYNIYCNHRLARHTNRRVNIIGMRSSGTAGVRFRAHCMR